MMFEETTLLHYHKLSVAHVLSVTKPISAVADEPTQRILIVGSVSVHR